MSGRRRVLDEVNRARVCALLKAGCSMTSVAEFVGCDRGTIRREALRDPDFAHEIRSCELEAELRPLHALHSAAGSNWHAAAWLLERTKPEQYARIPSNLVRIETIHDFVTRCLEVIAAELDGSPAGASACRRVTSAIQRTCSELTVAAMASRDPKRLRKIIAAMTTDDACFTESAAEMDQPEVQFDRPQESPAVDPPAARTTHSQTPQRPRLRRRLRSPANSAARVSHEQLSRKNIMSQSCSGTADRYVNLHTTVSRSRLISPKTQRSKERKACLLGVSAPLRLCALNDVGSPCVERLNPENGTQKRTLDSSLQNQTPAAK
jgi:hypothetical protein